MKECYIFNTEPCAECSNAYRIANAEYDYVDRSKGEYDCFPNYHSKGGY